MDGMAKRKQTTIHHHSWNWMMGNFTGKAYI
jgi:hypothetical protein